MLAFVTASAPLVTDPMLVIGSGKRQLAVVFRFQAASYLVHVLARVSYKVWMEAGGLIVGGSQVNSWKLKRRSS